MATITLQYNARNKAARAIVEMIERSGLFDILKDDEPNETTIKAISDAKAGKTFKATQLQEMFNYLDA